MASNGPLCLMGWLRASRSLLARSRPELLRALSSIRRDVAASSEHCRQTGRYLGGANACGGVAIV